MCTRIKISRYLVIGCHEKLSSSYRWYQKRTLEPMFVRTESLLSRAIYKNVLRDFYRGLSIVVHLYSNFSMCSQMAPVQSIRFQTANFPIFCGRIIVIFWTTCIASEAFSLVIMGNDTQVLPVLHWLEVVIAFVSSYYYSVTSHCNVLTKTGTLCDDHQLCRWTKQLHSISDCVPDKWLHH